jgi:glycosyltransferase involved in cell wall biosynthesis
VPAYNAAGTLSRTLLSASRQTYRDLEILVVDDGSTDDTARIVQGMAEQDDRIRLLRKANGGVASARNLGIKASRGEFVATLDADDLWHPTKIEKQIACFAAEGPDCGLVYAPFRVIDMNDRVLSSWTMPRLDGWMFLRHAHLNVVGCGSSTLFRRSILETVGGYEPSLRARGAEGCEDYLLQLQIATRYRFGVVPEYLIGYRRSRGSMSSRRRRMVLSRKYALEAVLRECAAEPARTSRRAITECELTLFFHSPSLRAFLKLLGSPGIGPVASFRLATHARKLGRRMLGHTKGYDAEPSAPHFFDLPTIDDTPIGAPNHLSRLIARLEPLDIAFGHGRRYLADTASPMPDPAWLASGPPRRASLLGAEATSREPVRS